MFTLIHTFPFSGYLELLINTHFNKPSEENHVTYITPLDVTSRGCQLSFAFTFPIEHVFKDLIKRGVVVSFRYNISPN